MFPLPASSYIKVCCCANEAYKIPQIPLGVAVQLGSKRLVCHATEQALVKALMDDVSRSSAVAAKGF